MFISILFCFQLAVLEQSVSENKHGRVQFVLCLIILKSGSCLDSSTQSVSKIKTILELLFAVAVILALSRDLESGSKIQRLDSQ